ncbi:MAG: hypothetical protein J5646_06150 [Bacteroidales bacterium]|nr:hypothetical protein [Bacteroidales bacterium]MBR4739559.1 hypothetical protein [Bacteroidales bacterium]
MGTFVLTFLGCGTAMFLGCDTPAGVVGTAIAIGWCSLIGMGSTILITYSLQPLLFRWMLQVPFIRKTIVSD